MKEPGLLLCTVVAIGVAEPAQVAAQTCFGVPSTIEYASVEAGVIGTGTVDGFRIGGSGVLGPMSVAAKYEAPRRSLDQSSTWTFRGVFEHGIDRWSGCTYLRVDRYHDSDPLLITPDYGASELRSFTTTSFGVGIGLGTEFDFGAVTVIPYASPRLEWHADLAKYDIQIHEETKVGLGYDAGVTVDWARWAYVRVATVFSQPDGYSEYSRNEFVLEVGTGW
jgi:hypothetical protein